MASTVFEILGIDETACDPAVVGSINESVIEMKDIYQERLPYTEAILLSGTCYVWGEAFIANCITAMSTDNLSGMTEEEQAVFFNYILWSNNHTHSADSELEATAVGCTIPDELNNSYIVLEDGTITAVLCEDPLNDVAKEDLYKSLDNVFINILNCLPYNTCASDEGDVVSVTECPLT